MDYKLEILISFLKLLPPFLLISTTSYFISRIYRVSKPLDKALFIFLFNWFQIIIPIEMLSLFNAVTPLNLLIFYSGSFLICLVIYLRNKLKIRFSFFEIKSFFLNFYRSLKLYRVLKIVMIVWFIIILLTTLLIGLSAPPGNYDSMTYHLARAGFWKQHQSIDHYNTGYIHQNDLPINAEIGLLWIMLFTNSDSLTFLVQWISFIIIIICLYRILRILDYSPGISFVTAFIFSTFDLVILESTSTQNDLVVASFIVLTFYFLIKTLKNEQTNLKFIFLTGFAAALAIGTKTYAVLFIPGFLIFALLYGRINKRKILKILYIALFCLLGCVLFASYTWIQNYQSYNNIFSDPSLIPYFRIVDPNIRTFISNFIRHIALFYQYNSADFGIISLPLQNTINFIHGAIELNVSAPETTLGTMQFYISDPRFNYDESSFGLICFFLVLPAVFLNLILFFPLNRLNRKDRLDIKFKNSLKALIIPFSFFILLVLIFKWTYLSSRYLVAFVALIMVGFAESLDLLEKIRWKHFFKIFVSIIILLSLVSSFFPLFRNDYFKLIDLKGYSKFSIGYDERRGETLGTSRIAIMSRAKKMVDRTIGEESRLGLILDDGDWVYIFFGKDFKRNLQYISCDDWNNNSIEKLLVKKDLDGLLINTNSVFNRKDLDHPISKFINRQLLKVDKTNFVDYFKPLNACEFKHNEDGVIVEALGDDPYFESTFPIKFDSQDTIVMVIKVESPVNAMFQVFFDRTQSNYNEKDSKRYDLIEGENKIYTIIDDVQELNKIRIDPLNVKENSIIKTIEFFNLKKNLSNVKEKNEGNYILYYR